jgi:hypothetical protein
VGRLLQVCLSKESVKGLETVQLGWANLEECKGLLAKFVSHYEVFKQVKFPLVPAPLRELGTTLYFYLFIYLFIFILFFFPSLRDRLN